MIESMKVENIGKVEIGMETEKDLLSAQGSTTGKETKTVRFLLFIMRKT